MIRSMDKEKRRYQISTVSGASTLNRLWSRDLEKKAGYPSFQIQHWREEGAVGPETHGRVLYIPNYGLDVAMWCYEENPRALYHNPNDFVHTDSCMEAFINVFPQTPSYGYISVEMNHNGASHCSFGTGRFTRQFILQRGLAHPEVQVTDFEEEGQRAWSVHVLIKKALLEALYERPLCLEAGHVMKANFYKCGDHTDQPHWGSWSKVEKLDFHTPETFGELEIV